MTKEQKEEVLLAWKAGDKVKDCAEYAGTTPDKVRQYLIEIGEL
ncbi:hypothetical protein [Ignatzschineria rhizosphaerae]|nr:hypothetical protein [Ignatzschineria rhizosphaerae]